ncbi:MAG: hypothetical protein F4234_01540 [Gammaproteobacteria bacterium]|nr:hypothetical protein [Gammaproteobacteria bacterium]MYE98867.1 hypothetical protein [Gammaproteobacteria bacterium]MYH85021.1 hypothetical protein [Gammaproteobacteria bacterium]MYK05592.1 hypothetical protein [Gammaproteobacteria bacterium]
MQIAAAGSETNMKLLIQNAERATVSHHEFSAEDARCAVLESRFTGVGGNVEVDDTKGQYIIQDFLHQLRKAAIGDAREPEVTITISDDSDKQLAQHALNANAARFALAELLCAQGYEPKTNSADEQVGRFAVHDILQVLRKFAQEAPKPSQEIAEYDDDFDDDSHEEYLLPAVPEERPPSTFSAIFSGIMLGIGLSFLGGGSDDKQ